MTVAEDLTTAVVVGVIISALVCDIRGPLFFGSAQRFHQMFNPETDPDVVIRDFDQSRVVDQSALQAIEAVAEKYDVAGKTLRLRHLSRHCHTLLSKAGQLMVDSDDDPHYAIAVDYDIHLGRIGGHRARRAAYFKRCKRRRDG